MDMLSSKWKIPPIEKVYEAFSVIADDRISLFEIYAKVNSSDYKKEYIIEWTNNEYSSNDNASFFQGFIGYPVIAVLMLQGKIDYNLEIVTHFKNIKWKELNIQNKNKYSVVVTKILNNLSKEGKNIAFINNEVYRIYNQIKNINILYKRSKYFPPK